MNITLIRPPVYSVGLMGAQRVPFLGIAYIGAAAKKAGHTVDIVDMCGEDITHTEIIRDKYVAYGMPLSALNARLKPSEVFGFTCTFSQDWVFYRELIQYVRELYPESILIAGGEHISAVPEYCLEDCPELDACVIGEGEEAFTQLLTILEKGGGWSEVPSLVYADPKGEGYHYTPRADRIKNIDDIPWPAWDLIPMENYLSEGLNYHIKRGRTIPMLASRGCPHKCTFCSSQNMWTRRWIARNPISVVDEIEHYIKLYSANNFVFSDLTAVVHREGIVAFCNEILRRKLKITWQLPTARSEAMDHTILKLMHQAGCLELDFAIESGSVEVLKSVNKGNNPEKIASLIKDGLAIGMNLSVNVVLGLPREGLREFLKTYWLMMKMAFVGLQEINVFPFVPYPGSLLFEEFLRKGRIKLNDEYFLSLFGYADLSQAVSWSEAFSPKTLRFLRLFLMSSFYTVMFISHPGRIVRLIINVMRGVNTTKLEGVLG
ncbi:MAG: cobalamin-dependent protein, partial [Candidatus Brocadiales bacterium]|nr:cobalamin-dependent protein [Candidatus Brocadiales bacterium]